MTKRPKSFRVVQSVSDQEGRLWWFVQPPGVTHEAALQAAYDGGRLRGPFRTREELEADAFGPDCQLSDGGIWDPAYWEKKQ